VICHRVKSHIHIHTYSSLRMLDENSFSSLLLTQKFLFFLSCASSSKLLPNFDNITMSNHLYADTATPQMHQNGSAQSHPRPPLTANFYITRDSGARVPLVALDELPVHLQIVGVPRVLGPQNFVESGGIKYVGHFPHRNRFHDVRDIRDIEASRIHIGLPLQNTTPISLPGAQNPVMPSTYPIDPPHGMMPRKSRVPSILRGLN
jgi:hypothetical protein